MPGSETSDDRDLLRRIVRDAVPKFDVEKVEDERRFDERHYARRHVDVGSGAARFATVRLRRRRHFVALHRQENEFRLEGSWIHHLLGILSRR